MNKHIDTDDVFAILPSGKSSIVLRWKIFKCLYVGHLILNITKETYERLGLDGRMSRFCSKRDDHLKFRKFWYFIF